MTHRTSAAHDEYTRPAILARAGACGLPILAVAIVCARAMTAGLPIVIERPAVLVAASIFILAPFRRGTVEILQSIVALYLICIPVNEVHLQYFPISTSFLNIRVTYSAIPLALFGAGHLAGRWTSRRDDGAPPAPDLRAEWRVTAGIVVVHMLVLGALLHRVYGYGCEYDLQVLGSLALYLLVSFACWRPLRRMRVRQALGLVLVAFYALITAMKA
jgi:hypothetical protein